MSDRAELAALVADLTACIEAQRGRGLRSDAVEGELPVGLAPAPVRVPTQVLRREEPPAAPEGPAAGPPPTVAGWGQIAERVRSARTPLHHVQPTGAEGLAAIRADLGDCQRCRLCAQRKEIVFGVGHPDADLLIVGEAPGAQEDLSGEPFVGEAGQMLDRMLANVLGLSRDQVYIANIVKCRPPENRKPQADEAEVCTPFLHRQIQAVRPKILLVLGSVALEHLLHESGITKLRGQFFAWQGIPALATFHPAYLLRKPDDKKLVFEDLKLLRRRYDELGGRR